MTFQPRSQSPDEFPAEVSYQGVESAIVVFHPAATRVRTARPVPSGTGFGAAPAAAGSEVAAALSRQLAAQRRLCDALEAIADGLPDDLDAQQTLHVARSIGSGIRRAHRFEEDTVFPLLERSRDASPELFATLQRLHFEHWEDESFGDELAEKLIDYVRTRAAEQRGGKVPQAASQRRGRGAFGIVAAEPNGSAKNPAAEALGYMLRGFFEGLRRHIAFEEEHLVPLLAKMG
ncbi:hemerythrin domain-containing protein [Jiella avicenniae]|uniref:Hemerythrin domain-containing protein n=1 Tax=Jiella avicenniae TaxID=2907202 RepID=A0A9X1NXE9_9HYPH|nr:hemerythrin domain-containing protein [Jiella avicenniae]MCE7026540.1 hemerythrin domain-containing protein [Jiella avicenniae]